MKTLLVIAILLFLTKADLQNSTVNNRYIDGWKIGSYYIARTADRSYLAFKQGVVSEKQKTAYMALKSLENEFNRKSINKKQN